MQLGTGKVKVEHYHKQKLFFTFFVVLGNGCFQWVFPNGCLVLKY